MRGLRELEHGVREMVRDSGEVALSAPTVCPPTESPAPARETKGQVNRESEAAPRARAGSGGMDVDTDAHWQHPAPFTHEEFRSYLRTPEPPQQREARAPSAIMRFVRLERRRPLLLAELQKRYLQEA
jgi:hypothetical protein